MRWQGLARGTAAGIAGTAVVALLSANQREKPVYAPDRLVGRLASRYLHRELPSSQRRRIGVALRWVYGPCWGGAFGELEELAQISFPLAGLGLGVALWSFELVALPLTGATPGLESWGRGEILKDGVRAIFFGIATASAFALLS